VSKRNHFKTAKKIKNDEKLFFPIESSL